jgi:hypothetical protein
VGDVVGIMRSFQRMSEALINLPDQDAQKEYVPNDGSQCAPLVVVVYKENSRRRSFLELVGAMDVSVVVAWLDNMAMCFTLHDYTYNMKVCMAIFQMKGSSLIWWMMCLPQLNMVVEYVSWNLFEEWFQERYLSEKFIEC